jgi:cysteinyl-tRNA synthetase
MKQLIFNTYKKQKEEFIPIDKTPLGNKDNKPKIKIYVCGQTVYDYCHIGHARKAIVFDMVRRWFIAYGYEVIFVENITDVDDKIINRADQNQESIHELTNRFINAMNRDFNMLNIIPADYAPKATDYIPQMIVMIQKLIDKGYAYIANNGDVFFSIKKFKNYGHLSGKKLEDLQAGERVSLNEEKQDFLDFVLWKSTLNQVNQEASWDPKQYGNLAADFSFGKGRPGWHIECSAMSNAILGKHFDIHGGGQDLAFPHHENEIAQSESCNDSVFANYWMHNGFITVKDDKMSKSLGNFTLIHDLLRNFNVEVIRYFMLKTHYRSPLHYHSDSLQESKEVVDKIYHILQKQNITIQKTELNLYELDELLKDMEFHKSLLEKFTQAMFDDFNTPLSLAYLHECLGILSEDNSDITQRLFLFMANSLGLILTPVTDYMSFGAEINEEQINKLIHERAMAKSAKNYIKSDEIRNTLLAHKIVLKDNPDGSTSWYVQNTQEK